MKMSKETLKTYKFVRNTVLIIALTLSMFIPIFREYGEKNIGINHNTYKQDSISNHHLYNEQVYHLMVKN